ncbi:hypothetical protein Tco_1418350 [Tanacetum coccineum]
MDSDHNNQNDQRELNLDISDSDLRFTPVLRPYSSTRVETSTINQKSVRIIPGPTGIVQAAKLLKQTEIQDGGEVCVMSTKEYMKNFVEDVGEDEDFKSGSWVSDRTKTHDSSWIVYSSDCLDLISRIMITMNIKNMYSGNSITNKVIQQGFSSKHQAPILFDQNNTVTSINCNMIKLS